MPSRLRRGWYTQGQEDVQFRITFTAKGPIYDEGDTDDDGNIGNDTNAVIVITVPE